MYAQRLAERIAGLRRHLPQPVVTAAQAAVLDTFGVLLRGCTYPNMAPLGRVLGANPGASTTGTARVPWCTEGALQGYLRLSPAAAALYAGTAAHSVELDDFHRAAATHCGVVVLPAALAVAEATGASGLDLLRAVAAGYEVMSRVGMAVAGGPYKRGFLPTAICGPFGSAAAAGLLLGLDVAGLTTAFGIAGSYAGGLMEYKATGAWTKRLAAGLAAQQGVLAAFLAREGFTGPPTILEGEFGFLRAYSDVQSWEHLEPAPDAPWCVTEISVKPYASCRFTHAPIDALFATLQAAGSPPPSRISRIAVWAHSQAIRSTMVPSERKYRPQTVVDAQFSLPFCLAAALHHGKVMPEQITPACWQDPVLLDTADRVEATVDPAYDALFPAQNACRVVLEADGRRWESEVLDAKGDPENPLSQPQLEAKFLAMSALMLGAEAAEVMLQRVQQLARLPLAAQLWTTS